MKPHPTTYDKWDRWLFVCERPGFRYRWKLVDKAGEGMLLTGPSHLVGDRLLSIVASGRAWTLRGARHAAYWSMMRKAEPPGASTHGFEMTGGALAFKVDAERRADLG